jgi:hypothetical protein
MANGAEFKFEEMTLMNAGQGALQERFQECLTETLAIFDEAHAFEESKGRIKTKITATVEMTYDLESRTRIVEVGCELKRPRRRTVSEAVFVRDGVLLVQPEVEQQKLFPLPVPGAQRGE